MFSKVIFKSCWPTHSTSRQFQDARQIRRTVSGSQNFCSAELLRGSFIPPVVIRDLRDLTRARTSLSQEHSRIASRIQKVLEDANIKLASVASNTLGKSGRAILQAIISGEESSERLADLALGHLRQKIPQLQAALEGKVREHHRFLLQSLLRQLGFIETEIELLDARLDQLGQEHLDLADALNRWDHGSGRGSGGRLEFHCRDRNRLQSVPHCRASG